MAEQEFTGESRPRTSSPFNPGNILTPKATAIAGFAFAVFSLLGQGSWGTAISALLSGNNYDVGAFPNA